MLLIICPTLRSVIKATQWLKRTGRSSKSSINEPFNTSTNHFSSKDRHSKLRNVDLEHGHVYIVKHHKHKLTAKKGESNTNIAYQK